MEFIHSVSLVGSLGGDCGRMLFVGVQRPRARAGAHRDRHPPMPSRVAAHARPPPATGSTARHVESGSILTAGITRRRNPPSVELLITMTARVTSNRRA